LAITPGRAQEEGVMSPQFRLVFRHPDGDRSELWDNNHDGEPHIDGQLVVDGRTYTIRGVEWILKREDHDGMKRFVCTLVVGP
jgi:hypothetical protein